MLGAESFFNLAEAKVALTGVTLPSTAKTYYEQGVKESFRVTGTTADPATTILVNGKQLSDWSVALTTTQQLQTIWLQKWLALTDFSGFEAWCDFRRTNYPNLPASAGAPIGQALPVRLFYPNTEEATNGANVKAQGTINVFTGKLFWDID